MRPGLVLLSVVVSGVVLACGGHILSEDEEGGPPPEAAAEATQAARISYCTELAAAAKQYFACTGQSAPATYHVAMIARCERIAVNRARCAAQFEALTRCQARELARCAGEHDACEPEEDDYLDCASGGSCQSLGGTSFDEETSSTHEACECAPDERSPGAPPPALPGGECQSPAECASVCCRCSPAGEYTASMCDRSASGGNGPGRCATAEETCAATAWRCDEMLVSKNRL